MKYDKMLMLLTLVAAGLAAGCSDDEDPLKDWTGPSKPGTEIKTPAEVGNRVVAHRGGSTEAGTRQFPDNSVAALNYAIGLGCYASECDIYLTKDDDVVVAHASAGCYINNLKPWEHTLAELRAAGTLANGEQLPSLADFIEWVRLRTDLDTVTEDGQAVTLMTVHTAKGLEFPYVFLCGMNEGIFPSRKVRTLPGMEEERRLAFVALTRAEKGLYLSEADGWNFDGSPRYPSRFLLDIDRELLSFTHEVDETLLREAADDVARRDKYLREDDGDGTLPIGQRVRHAVFGEGTVLDVDLNKGAHVIQFDGMGTPRSISLRAKLEKIGP
mgnify:CR=1 FL=1